VQAVSHVGLTSSAVNLARSRRASVTIRRFVIRATYDDLISNSCNGPRADGDEKVG
jgi:hypothetical protein